MAQRFLIIYPDGSSRKVSADEKKAMLNEGILRPAGGNRFLYLGQPFIFRALADLGVFLKLITTEVRFTNYPGFFIREFRHKRSKEILESPEHMELRLKSNGTVP